MKKLILISIAIISMYCIACKDKKVEPHYDITYLELYNKPLDTIRHYLNGKWKVHKTQGGTVLEIKYPKNTFLEFKFGATSDKDSIKWYNDTIIFANSKAIWNRENPYVYVSDTTYLLHYLDRYTFYNSKLVYKITNDTLTIVDDFPDGYASYCTKVK